MKLNPFTKKSTAYYDKVKADFNKLNQERRAEQATGIGAVRL